MDRANRKEPQRNSVVHKIKKSLNQDYLIALTNVYVVCTAIINQLKYIVCMFYLAHLKFDDLLLVLKKWCRLNSIMHSNVLGVATTPYICPQGEYIHI